MGSRLARLLVFGVGAALAPTLVVVAFTWLRLGSLIGWGPLLGRGELLPATALLAGQIVLGAHEARQRDATWHIAVGLAWLMFAVCCVLYVVPYSAPVSPETRVAVASVATLFLTTVSGVLLIRKRSA